MKRIDLTGQRFGRLTVIRYDHSEHDGAHWLCKCDCGNEKVAAGYSLRSGKTKSCGCLNSDASRAKLEKARAAIKARPRKDLTGQRFGRLVVLGLADVPDRKGFIFWRVRCDCGNEKVIMQNNFIYGQTRSCCALSLSRISTSGWTASRPGGALSAGASGRKAGQYGRTRHDLRRSKTNPAPGHYAGSPCRDRVLRRFQRQGEIAGCGRRGLPYGV